MTDDGSALTSSLANSLMDHYSRVVLLSYPDKFVHRNTPLENGIPVVRLNDLTEDHLTQNLEEISSRFGPVGAFIHLNPDLELTTSGTEQTSESEKAIVKHIFLLAKHLKEPLNLAANRGRGIFMSVTHLDGEFGLSGKKDFDPISGGLGGLVKTLNLEWEPVFCRALDLDPQFDVEEACNHILAELFDPNRLITEVGYSILHGRQTIIVEPASSMGGIK